MVESLGPQAEFEAVPTGIIISDVRHMRDAFEWINEQITDPEERERQLDINGLLDFPDPDVLEAEYAVMRNALTSFGDFPVLMLGDMVGDTAEFRHEKDMTPPNPNLPFTRDPATTIPWAPELFIPSNMSLRIRSGEVPVMSRALEALGMQPAIEFEDERLQFLEGGDLLPTVHDGERVLMIGLGERTRLKTAKAIADRLVPEVFDSVLAVSHDPLILHLDTGYIELPEKTVLMAEGMFSYGHRFTKKAGEDVQLTEVAPEKYLVDRGYNIISVGKEAAIDDEACNLVPLGDGRFLSFTMDEDLRDKVVELSGANITEVPGREISKLTGGVHCLTRNVYAPIPAEFLGK